ncbi:MAG: Asp-tRNA(Asn)/Glu-tRNA(Gln) amidotransferase subunit GatC [Candidatus Nomurabacteria bacterium]|nr:Asp-tRNA(Asn)/Glu-tRNA(Gln) amidotransferase subunit GatC [Candidatus Nomurabacteria bacterium]
MEIKDVENLAELAKIELNDAEKQQLLSDMKGILDYVKVIESVEVSDSKIENQHINIWREDVLEVREFSRDLIISQFPESQDGFLKIKKVL